MPPTPPAPTPTPTTLAAPVAGPVVRHFGDATPDGPAAAIAYATGSAAPVTAPCTGRVAFAGPFRSYGNVLILDCGSDSVVLTGLARTDATPGTALRRGAALGRMPDAPATLTVQLRRAGVPADPLAPPRPQRLTRVHPTGIARNAPHPGNPP